MKAVDTNVLVRLLTRDDPRQAKRALEFIEHAEKSGQSVLVSNPVLMELCWVLRSAYEYSRDEVIGTIEQLAMAPVFAFESREILEQLVTVARSSSIDIPDLIIALTAKQHDCETTLTFDKRAAKSTLFELI
ncbi:type II toxin-antitoxin system VapC family toxin [bacterium]|nr:type II toxin-antitoxin system VapC family toxin [bacterium]